MPVYSTMKAVGILKRAVTAGRVQGLKATETEMMITVAKRPTGKNKY
jgi:hypothetical protein